MNIQKFNDAIRLFDEANLKDPNKELFKGKEYPKELLYAIRMSKKLDQFSSDPSEALKLTVRCQHICRWKIPRNEYPMNRVGYLTWRKDLKYFHVKKAVEILKDVEYDDTVINSVIDLLQKKQIKKNEETQILEDVICLVFLEFYFSDFSKKYKEEKLVTILQKTWKKMSDNGHKAALSLQLSEKATQLIAKALS